MPRAPSTTSPIELARTYNAPKDQHTGRHHLDAAGPRRQGRREGVSVQTSHRSRCGRRVLKAPVGLLAELTHRCPLQCPYCSNPLALERVASELPTEIWLDVLAQAADLGVLQLHLSGGEPTVAARPGGDRRAGRQGRPLLQPHHIRRDC